MTTYSSFKPSVQFLEAGEKAQQFANAANTFKPFLPQEARQSIEGVDKVAQAFTATGRALEHFGFDEAEPELDQADSIAGETTTTENVGRMHSSATFIGGTGTSQSWYNGQKVSDQLASVDEAEFDQDQEEVGGKWSNRWNKFLSLIHI